MKIQKRLWGAALALAAVWCGLCTTAFAQPANQAPYVVTVYNERNGLPTGEANVVLQTGDGYVWIGSYGGLIRYDGTAFYNYSEQGLLPSSSVRALYEDSAGRLWVGTNDAGVFWLENGVLTAVENPDPATYLCVRGFDEGADGVIYVASNSGMGEIRDGRLTAYTDAETSGRTVYTVSVDSYGRVWGALNFGVCAVVQDGKTLRTFASDELFDDGVEIYCTAADGAGRVYLGSSGNVMARLTFPTESLEPGDLAIEYIDTPAVTTHNNIQITGDGWVIVCGNVGACALGPEGAEHALTAEDGASAVNSGCVDYEGNIWLASTSSGILKYTRGYFETPNKAAGLADIAINAVALQGGRAYVGTNTGLLIFDEAWQPVENELTQLFAGARIRSLLADSRGRVWVAAYLNQSPAVCYDPADETLQIFTMAEGLVNASARSLLELSDGSVAVGTQGGLSLIRDGAVIANYTADQGLDNGSILCILEGGDGSLLVGTDGGGVFQIKGELVVQHFREEGLADGVVLRMIRDEESGGYFVSAGSSLYYWNEAGFTKLPVQKSAGSIFDFLVRDGKVWILQNSGIRAFDRQALLAGENPLPKEFSFAHGLTGSLDANTWNWQDSDGRLYMATRSGVSIFGFETVTGTLPKGMISGVRADGDYYARPQSVELGQNVNRVTIDFSALSFTDTADVGFLYQLHGFDESETALTDARSGSISYTNLPAGEYTFRLRIYLLDRPELFTDYTLTLHKTPKVWERLPVRILTVAALAALVALAVAMRYRAKIRSIQKRQQIYREIVEQLQQELARTADAHAGDGSGAQLDPQTVRRLLAMIEEGAPPAEATK